MISGVMRPVVARQLVLRHSEKTTNLEERHNRAGEETRWTPRTQSMGSSLIHLSLAPITRKSAMEVCPSQHAKTNKVLTGSNQAFTISPDSPKTRLSLGGRHLLHEHCDQYSIGYQNTGKLVVGHPHQWEYLQNLHKKAQRLLWPPAYDAAVPDPDPSKVATPIELISGNEVRSMEPDLSPDISLALSVQ